MILDWLLEKFVGFKEYPAIVYRDESFSYQWLLHEIEEWENRLNTRGIGLWQITAVIGDYSPQVIAAILTLINRRDIIVPLSSISRKDQEKFLAISQSQNIISFDSADNWVIESKDCVMSHPLFEKLRETDEPGLIVFSSGSTGVNKATLHSFSRLLEKYKKPRKCQRILVFLLLDHLGGINTLFHTLSNGGTIVIPHSRGPEAICEVIERHKVEVLPTSPTFLNLLLLSGAYTRYDLSSLRLITYGTEAMPESTLKRLRETLPHAELLQTYGLTELGVLRSKSRSSDSLWFKVGGEEFHTKIVDGILYIKAHSAMLGYLNAPDPFDADGWMKTGDKVEVDGEWIRILGRESEMINVGGQKVFPAEVESVLQLMDNVEDVAVSGEWNRITGQIVSAKFKLCKTEAMSDFRKRMREFCAGKLSKYMIPQKITLVDTLLYNERFKRIRRE